MGSVLLLEPPAAVAPSCSWPRRRAMLVSVSSGVAAILAPMLGEIGMEIVDPDEASAVGEHTIIVAEADRGTRLLQMIQDMRRRAGRDAFLVGITGWWCDCEPELRAVADALLHAPLRASECRALLEMLPAIELTPTPAGAR
jgi:hypothetical protein